jgi:hypothetical protein
MFLVDRLADKKVQQKFSLYPAEVQQIFKPKTFQQSSILIWGVGIFKNSGSINHMYT